MAIRFIGAAWKAAQATFPPAERVYLDFRQLLYPPLTGQDLAYTVMASGDNQPGSHNLTGGHADYLLPLPSTLTIRARVLPTFAYNVATDQPLWSWYYDADNYLTLAYLAADDTYTLKWKDGGTERVLKSAAYESDGALQVWTDIDCAIDLTTGDTSGSALYINRVAMDTAWSGAIDAKGMEYPKLSLRHENATEGGYTINHLRIFSGKVVTATEVAADYSTVTNEEIIWHLNGEGCGRTRCNVTRHVRSVSAEKSVENPLSGAQGANRAMVDLYSIAGEFADDQYAAYDPTSDQFNGLVTQAYLKQRSRLEIESWYDHDFELAFTGQLDEGCYSRSTQLRDATIVSLTAEDTVARLARKLKRSAVYYEDYDLCKPATEAESLLHTVARLATKEDIYNFLANASFENATIGNSWTVAGTGATFSRVAGGLFGSYQGDLVYGSAACTVSQTVTFTGDKKLNVGETYTVLIWLRSAGACGDSIVLAEHDGSGLNDSSSATYSIAGGEGWKLYSVSHTLTDSDSDRLVVTVELDDNVTLSLDGAMLLQGSQVLNWFVLNDNDGAAGVESADDADADSYDTVGFDADAVAVTHPWVMIPAGETVWEHLKQIGEAAGCMYLGMDECGALRFRAKLATGYADPSSLATLTSVQEVESTLDEEQANKIIGHGVKIKEYASNQLVWNAAAAGDFTNAAGSGTAIRETVTDGSYFPDPATYPEYWAKYNVPIEATRHALADNQAATASSVRDYKPNDADAEVIGMKDAVLKWTSKSPTGIDYPENSGADVASTGMDLVTFDSTTRADSARLLLLNDSGLTQYLTRLFIHGKPVVRYSGEHGFLHDSFLDYDDIRANGERVYEFGNNYICSASQLQQLADWAWKRNRTRRHLYTVSLAGRRFDFTPGEWYTLQVGGAGEREYIDAVCECYEVQVECAAGELGRTVLTLREVYQNWTYDSGAVARYLASGDPRYVPNFNLTKVASATYGEAADFYCDGTADQTEIAAAITMLSAGGILSLTEGTFVTAAVLEPQSNQIIDGAGASTIIEKNCNDYAVDIQGAAETYLEHITIRDLKLTRNASDTNAVALLHMQYAKHVVLENVDLEDSYGDAAIIENCEDIKLVKCRVNGAEVNGMILKQTIQAAILSCLIASCGGIGCELITDDATDMIDRGDCESTTTPAATGESSATTQYATWARSAVVQYGGSYSYALTATDAGLAAAVALTDNADANDLHGATAGKVYRFTARIYVPSGLDATEGYIAQAYSLDGSTKLYSQLQRFRSVNDEWQLVESIFQLPTGAQAWYPLIVFEHPSVDDVIYVDQIQVLEGALINNGYILDNTTIKNCDGDGVYVATNEARITNNILQGNGDKGLRIAGGARNYVFNNAATDNGDDSGIDNSNEDNFYDAGEETQVGLNSWQGVGV